MQSQTSKSTKYLRIDATRLTKVLAVIFFAAVLFFVFDKTAHADIASFLNFLTGQEQVSAKTKEVASVSDSQISRSIVLTAQANPGQTFSPDVPPIDGDTILSPDIARMNATTSEPQSTQISTYIVRSGDTISDVAKMFNVSVNTILWANDLTSRSYLKPGQTLVILPVTGITYTVKSRDTIQSIAKKFGADVEDIVNYNDLSTASILKIGDEILIPDAEMSAPPAPVVTQKRITKAPYEPILDGPGWPSYPGYFACPLPGSRVSQELHGHNGIDLAAPRGTPIRAAADGTVIINRSNGAWNGGYGNFVVVLHPNGTQTLYAHMSKSIVYSGVKVSQGQTIGYVGMSGLTTGPHIHFEIRGAQNPFGNQALCK